MESHLKWHKLHDELMGKCFWQAYRPNCIQILVTSVLKLQFIAKIPLFSLNLIIWHLKGFNNFLIEGDKKRGGLIYLLCPDGLLTLLYHTMHRFMIVCVTTILPLIAINKKRHSCRNQRAMLHKITHDILKQVNTKICMCCNALYYSLCTLYYSYELL